MRISKLVMYTEIQMTLQDITIQTYQDNFDMYKEKTPNEMSGEFVVWMNAFIALLPRDGYVFEFGSAEGRDARYLRDRGVQMYCTDVIPQALEELSVDNFKTAIYDFREDPHDSWQDAYDGVLAKAVFLHASQEMFEKALRHISVMLKHQGVACLTFKLGKGDEIETDKLGGKRYFKLYEEEELIEIIRHNKDFEIIKTFVMSELKWTQVLLKKIG